MNQTITGSSTRKYAQGSQQKAQLNARNKKIINNNKKSRNSKLTNANTHTHKLQTRNGKTSTSIECATGSSFVGGNWVITSKPFVAKPFSCNALTR